MKRNVTIVLLSIITILAISYALYQKSEAEQYLTRAAENEELASKNAMMAREQMTLAEKQRAMAEAIAMEAQRQNHIASEALEKCKKSK